MKFNDRKVPIEIYLNHKRLIRSIVGTSGISYHRGFKFWLKRSETVEEFMKKHCSLNVGSYSLVNRNCCVCGCVK